MQNVRELLKQKAEKEAAEKLAIHERGLEICEAYLASFSSDDSMEELMKLTKAELVAMVLELKKAKTKKPQTGELITKLLIDPVAGKMSSYTLAELVCLAIQGAKTSHRSVDSIASDCRANGMVLARDVK